MVVVFDSCIGMPILGYHKEPRILASPPPATIRSQAHREPFGDVFARNGVTV
jgi:hypothetical protein